MAYPTNIDPAIIAQLQQQALNYRPGETDAPWLHLDASDPGFGYTASLNQGVYGGEGSTPTYTLGDNIYAGDYDNVAGGDMAKYDSSGQSTGTTEHWKGDWAPWMDTAAMLAAGGFGAGFGALAAGAGGGATLGAANGSWDVLPEAVGSSDTGALAAAFNPAADSQLANTLIEQSAPGFEQFGGDAISGYTQAGIPSVDIGGPNFTNTDSVFNPAKDSQLANDAIEARAPGFEQFDGDALSGYTGAPAPSVDIGNFGGAGGSSFGSDLFKGIKPADAIKLITAAVGAASDSTGSGSGSGTSTGAGGTTTPFDYGPARYLPPGWRQDRPMYVPGQDAIPDGWFGAGYTKG